MTEFTGTRRLALAVSDLEVPEHPCDSGRSQALAVHSIKSPPAEQQHAQYINRHFDFMSRPSRSGRAHEPCVPDLHHFRFGVDSAAEVCVVKGYLQSLKIDASEAALNAHYLAAFTLEPVGIRLEIANYRRERRERHVN